jgi:DNA-binding beta-propeller fold protein YncE
MVLENGVAMVRKAPLPDTISIIEMSGASPRIIAELPVPASVVGPPPSVAIAPDESFVLVTGAMKVDPADPTKTVADDKLTVIDLKSSPPKIIATLQAGLGAAGVSINRATTLALVANRSEGTVSIFTISGNTLTPSGKIALGDAKSGPCHVIFSRDGATALVTRDGDSRISILSVDGNKVEYTKRDLYSALRPYQIDTTGNGDVAMVGNVGMSSGDADSISLIDMRAKPIRVANTIAVGQTPEGVKMSPDGAYVAVTVMNGSNKPKTSPFYDDNGLLKIYRINGTEITPVTEAKIGHWCQGIAWSKDSKTVLAQCMVEDEIATFTFDGKTLTTIHGPRYRMLVIGASQLSKYLAQIAVGLDYQVTICDPREEYTETWDIPGVALVRTMPDDTVRAMQLDERCAVVALTHDPKLDDLALCHDPRYVENVLELIESGATNLAAGDVSVSKESGEVALRAVGGVIDTVDAVLTGRVQNAFCAVRPPGHHARPAAPMGFCEEPPGM